MRIGDLKPGELELAASAFLFGNLSGCAVAEAVAEERCTLEEFRKGKAIYTPTEFRRSLALLLSGSAGVSKGGLHVSVLRAGELFGAAALFTELGEFETTVTAREACRVLFFPQEQVSALLARYPEAAAGYIRYLSGRIHFLSRKLDGLLASGAAERLGRYLLAQAGSDGAVECSAVELSRRLDVSRASLYRAFAELEASGAIVRRGKRVLVADRDKLRDKTRE